MEYKGRKKEKGKRFFKKDQTPINQQRTQFRCFFQVKEAEVRRQQRDTKRVCVYREHGKSGDGVDELQHHGGVAVDHVQRAHLL